MKYTCTHKKKHIQHSGVVSRIQKIKGQHNHSYYKIQQFSNAINDTWKTYNGKKNKQRKKRTKIQTTFYIKSLYFFCVLRHSSASFRWIVSFLFLKKFMNSNILLLLFSSAVRQPFLSFEKRQSGVSGAKPFGEGFRGWGLAM